MRRRRVRGTISGLRAGPAVFGLRNAPAGAVRASSPTGVCGTTRLPFPGWPRYSPSSVGADSISARRGLRRRGVPAIRARRLRRRTVLSKFCFLTPSAFERAVLFCPGLRGGRAAYRGAGRAGDSVRGGQCARAVPKQDALPRAPQFCPPVRPLPGDAAAPRRYNGGRLGIPCVSQRGGYPLYQ